MKKISIALCADVKDSQSVCIEFRFEVKRYLEQDSDFVCGLFCGIIEEIVSEDADSSACHVWNLLEQRFPGCIRFNSRWERNVAASSLCVHPININDEMKYLNEDTLLNMKEYLKLIGSYLGLQSM